ncbi:MAG: efflux RND transporter periplasmic adaptor subunit [Defluviitaleaceae bacterium]|nr:efflux RND transporter periplasmic adaptor subunit [Defluviitaleaceae bacterium]
MNKRKLVILGITVATVAAIGGGVVYAGPFGNNTGNSAQVQDILNQEVAIERTDLSQVFSTSGIVRSADTQYVFSSHSRPVREILVSVGDTVQAGDVLAVLDMSNVENDIAQTELNLINAQRNAADEQRNNANSVTNARTSVDSAVISLERQNLNLANAEHELETAQADANTPFDTTLHDRAIADAEINVERRRADVEEAQRDLLTAPTDFDDHHHIHTINEAQITLDRRLADLAEAEEQLDEEVRARNEPFDPINFQIAITDAERNLERRRADESTAHQNLSIAWNTYVSALPAQQSQARTQLDTAQVQVDNARRAVEDAEFALTRARDDLTRARNNHNDNQSDIRETAITTAERHFNNAQNAADDAQRTLDRAIADLDRAINDANRANSDAESNADTRLTTAINHYNDAVRVLERAINDKYRAMDDSATTNENRLNNAQRSLDDSQNQRQSAENSLRSAQEGLNQAASRPNPSSTNVEIQELNLDRLNTSLTEGIILAPGSGVITEINASVGATTSGVLFIIEDVNNLYVSANVREHSLGSLEIGQQAFVTTEVTGRQEYGAELTFISPRSVSPQGSTSVEFEIHAAMNDSDTNVRIGMNAFINVILNSSDEVYAVPINAVVSTERGSFIAIRDEDGEVSQIPVEVGISTSTHVAINSPLIYEGMMILARPALAAAELGGNRSATSGMPMGIPAMGGRP